MSQSDFVTRGQALVAAGQYQEAVKVCRLGLLGRPTTVEGRVVLGQALLALKRFDEVLAEMRVALELDHMSISAQVLKGEALLRKGDPQAAMELFQKVRQQAPTDLRIAELLAEAERGAGRPTPISAVHPSVGFVSPGESFTKHYPNHGGAEVPDGQFNGDEDSGGGYTRPTSLSSPGSGRRSSRRQAVVEPKEPTPPPNVLAVGDRSGTMEVDPETDGIEQTDRDFDEVAPPPRSRRMEVPEPAARGSIQRSQKSPQKSPGAYASAPKKKGSKKPNAEISTVELGDDEMIEMEEEAPSRPSRSQVRNAVQMPSGPLDMQPPMPAPTPASKRPTQLAPAAVPPPQLAQMIAAQPHAVQYDPVGKPRAPISSTLPTAAGAPMPVPPLSAAAARTIALSPAQQQSANAVDALFAGEVPPLPQPAPAWAQSTVVAGTQQAAQQQRAAAEPTVRPSGIDPQLQDIIRESQLAMGTEPPSNSGARPLRTGVRKTRSRLQILVWFFIGMVVIGGGVFAGFQIRSIRLRKQIEAERSKAVDAAKADTYLGWAQARDSLAGIVHASPTIENKAALARTRALLAYEYLDGIADAKLGVEGLANAGGLDGAIAAVYVALAANDAKAARAAADAAQKLAPTDPAVLYVTGLAQLLANDYKNALATLKAAVDAEPRPLYQIGYARGLGAVAQYEDALAAVERALTASPDHPGAVIERAFLLADSGRLAANSTVAAATKSKLERVIIEGGKPAAEQPHGVSAVQVAFADLALAEVDYALGQSAAPGDVEKALKFNIEDQRFAETSVEVLYAISDLGTAQKAALYVLKKWPASLRGRLTLAQLQLAAGKATDALDTLTKSADVMALPTALAVRAQAKAASNDLDAAALDFDKALEKTPGLELALVGRAEIDLARGDVEGAKKRIRPRYNEKTAGIALTTIWATILHAAGDPDAARALLEKLVTGMSGLEIGRAQLELARAYRDLGDERKARAAYADAVRNNNPDAEIEIGVSMIDAGDPLGGRETLNQLYAKAGDRPNPRLVLETARARMLVGDHNGAVHLLDDADKLGTVSRWQYNRERARLAYRRGDVSGAADAIGRALIDCGDDGETFVLAADIASADATSSAPKHPQLLPKLKELVGTRLKNIPEAAIVEGKLAYAANDLKGAEAAYKKALTDLESAKASKRRRAQANFGLAAVDYANQDDPNALDKLDAALAQDPSLYDAYVFYAEIAKAKDPKKALDKAKKAVELNPEYVAGWGEIGDVAAKLGDKRLLADAITKLNELAPASEELKKLVALKR